MSSIDSLLDGTLDDLADMTQIKPFPVGTHRATIKWEMKKINGNDTPIMKVKAIETVELSDDKDTPCSKDQTADIAFSFLKKDGTPNEIGQGQFKEIMKSLAEHYGAKSPRELMAESQNAEVLLTTTIRTDKKDENDIKHYTAIKALAVV
jgi:hypothetical protein